MKQNATLLSDMNNRLSKLKAELRTKRIELEQAEKSAGGKASKALHRGLILVAEVSVVYLVA